MAEIPLSKFDAAKKALEGDVSEADERAAAREGLLKADLTYGSSKRPNVASRAFRNIGGSLKRAGKETAHGMGKATGVGVKVGKAVGSVGWKGAKASGENLLQGAKGAGYIIKHPRETLPGIGKSIATGWAENTFHPLITAKKLVKRENIDIYEEAGWLTGAVEGAVTTFIIYNTMPPLIGRALRTGLSLAWAGVPATAMKFAKVRQEGEIKARGAASGLSEADIKAEVSLLNTKYSKAERFLRSHRKSRGAFGSMAAVVSASGLAEHVIFGALGLQPEEVVQKGFNKAGDWVGRIISRGADQHPALVQATEQIMNSQDFQSQLSSIDTQASADAFLESGKYYPDEVRSQIHQNIVANTQGLVQSKIAEAANKYLTEHSGISDSEAAQKGTESVLKDLADRQSQPYQELVDANKSIVAEALKNEQVSQAVEDTTRETLAQAALYNPEFTAQVTEFYNSADYKMTSGAVRDSIGRSLAIQNGVNWQEVSGRTSGKTLASLESHLKTLSEGAFKKAALEVLDKDPKNIQEAIKAGQNATLSALVGSVNLHGSISQAAGFMEDVNTAFNESLAVDKYMTDHGFETAKSAVVNAVLIDHEFDKAAQAWGVNSQTMTPQVLAEVKRRFHQSMLNALKGQADTYFDPQAEAAYKGDVSVEQAIAAGRGKFFVDLNNPDSDLNKTVNSKAIVSFRDLSFAVEKEALVGAHMVEIDKATEDAIAKLGITGQLSESAVQAIHDDFQHKAERLANSTLDQSLRDHDFRGSVSVFLDTAKEHFEQNLAPTLDKDALQVVERQYIDTVISTIVDEQGAVAEQTVKSAVAQVVGSEHPGHIMSEETLKEAKGRVLGTVYDRTSAIEEQFKTVDLNDPNPEHLRQAVKQAVTAGKKQVEDQLAVADPKTGLNPLQAKAVDALNDHFSYDERMRGNIKDVLAKVPKDHLTTFEVPEGQTDQTVSHILLNRGQALEYGSQDARKIAAYIAINYDQLANAHYGFEAEHIDAPDNLFIKDNLFPVTLEDLYRVMLAAENGDTNARQRLMAALWATRQGQTVMVLNLADQQKIIDILKSGAYK